MPPARKNLGTPGDLLVATYNHEGWKADTFREIKQVVDQARVIMDQEAKDSAVPAPLRDFLMYAFLAETTLKPSETILFHRLSPNGESYYGYEPKTIKNTTVNAIIQSQAERIVKKDLEIAELKKTIASMTEELAYLRKRR